MATVKTMVAATRKDKTKKKELTSLLLNVPVKLFLNFLVLSMLRSFIRSSFKLLFRLDLTPTLPFMPSFNLLLPTPKAMPNRLKLPGTRSTLRVANVTLALGQIEALPLTGGIDGLTCATTWATSTISLTA